MGRSKESFGKKEVRNKQAKKRKEKEQRKLERKDTVKKSSLDDMIAWVDENGVITSTPPDPTKKTEIDIESIEISIPKAEFRVQNTVRTGKLNSFDTNKGFGFIIDSDTRESIFVHINDCDTPLEPVGCKVEFETEKGLKGLKAINVKKIG
ncbi:cold shock domain-containing protein [Halosquirtibacter laminarini]|uniref:Cold shock domain-containing protein n=1 Tax=Halosquirtibacter laminarini TaxID=3374600 RepID=A0AC61NPB0_9BACT|nr:cold shock domain-containing protein [Prolixibacteraceae bacterium]